MRSAEMERLQRLLASERSRRMQAEQDVAMLQVRRLESTSSLHRLTPNHSPRSSMRSPSPGQRADKSLRIARGVLKHAHTVSSVSLSRVQRMALWQCRGHPELRGSPAALLGALGLAEHLPLCLEHGMDLGAGRSDWRFPMAVPGLVLTARSDGGVGADVLALCEAAELPTDELLEVR
jgi:hypothetical protein